MTKIYFGGILKKRALITGITGQDGSYLAEHLLKNDYEVFGLIRRTSHTNCERLDSCIDKVQIIDGDLIDLGSIIRALQTVKPDEIYNLAAQSFVQSSFEIPLATAQYTGIGALNMLEAMRIAAPKAKFYQASSSEMFGKVRETPQNEETPFHPRSPYGVAKVFAHYATLNYRESYNLFACSGILFNHESPRRGIEFVTRKITDGVARIKLGMQKELRLGNLDAKRDWGFAGDYVKAMHLMLQQDKPEDFVVGTGKNHTVAEFCEAAFSHVGLDWKDYVKTDAKFMRPAEVEVLLANPSKAKKVLGWKPEVSFKQLAEMMVDADVARLRREARSKK